MGVKDHLVQHTRSTARRSEDAGSHVHYLTYNPSPEVREEAGANVTYVVRVRLPKTATDLSLHGPGYFTKRGKGKVYGVRITFTEETEKGRSPLRRRTVELPHPAMNIQLLDRRPDEAYQAVA